MEMEALIAAVGSAGLSTALVIFFVYRSDQRYEKISQFVTDTLVGLVQHATTSNDDIAKAMTNIAQETRDLHALLASRPCIAQLHADALRAHEDADRAHSDSQRRNPIT